MRALIHNLLLAIDLVFTRRAYARAMLADGFTTSDTATRRELYRFFKVVT